MPDPSPGFEESLRLLRGNLGQGPGSHSAAIIDTLDELAIDDELAGYHLAENPRRAYLGHLDAWQEWCAERGLPPMPADPESVRGHLAICAVSVTDGQVVRDGHRRLAAVKAAVTVRARLRPRSW